MLDQFETCGEWFYRSHRNLEEDDIRESIRSLSVDPLNPSIFYVFNPVKWVSEVSSDLIFERWSEILGTALIPFSAENERALRQKQQKTFSIA
jgi:hypothetical protein